MQLPLWVLRNQNRLASSVSIFRLCAQLRSHCWETVGRQVANRCSPLKEIWEEALFAFSEHLYLLAHDSSREEGILEFGIRPRSVPLDAFRMPVPVNPVSPCLTTFPAPALMDEGITSPGSLLVWIWVNTSHPQLLYHNAALERRSCWKDVTFQQRGFNKGNIYKMWEANRHCKHVVVSNSRKPLLPLGWRPQTGKSLLESRENCS